MVAPAWLAARPVAHRGFHDRGAGRIENTLSAVRAAIEHGFSIEVDLQRTADGAVVVFHDDTVDRLLAGAGRVDAMSLAELKAIPFREGTDRVPTLQELLDTVAGRAPLVIELKSSFDGDRRLEAAVAPILARYAGPFVVMSFDPDSLRAMKRLAPAMPRGIVADRYIDPEWNFLSASRRFILRHLVEAASIGVDFVSFHVDDLPFWPPLFFKRVLGKTLITWTVRTPAQRARSERYADQMTFEGFTP